MAHEDDIINRLSEAELLGQERSLDVASEMAGAIGLQTTAQELRDEALEYAKERIGRFGMRFPNDLEIITREIIESLGERHE